MVKIAVFASGTGSNAVQLIEYFRNHARIKVSLVVTNNPEAPVIDKARKRNVAVCIINRKDFYESEKLLETLLKFETDFIILAGFMWLIPKYLVKSFVNKMVNIHPALLPDYGGKGMYGKRVHEAILKNGDKVSGITIHYVNEEYDRGERIFQATCKIDPKETIGSLAAKIHNLEHAYYPVVVEGLLSNRS